MTMLRGLFVGNASEHVDQAQLVTICTKARALSYDHVALKVLEGSIVWHDIATCKQFTQVAKEYEISLICWGYSYGDSLGAGAEEIALYTEYLHELGVFMLDCEDQYEGHPEYAAALNEALLPIPGYLYVTTFADPHETEWANVRTALRPCVNMWVPQVYTQWLEAHWENEWVGYLCQPAYTHYPPGGWYWSYESLP